MKFSDRVLARKIQNLLGNMGSGREVYTALKDERDVNVNTEDEYNNVLRLASFLLDFRAGSAFKNSIISIIQGNHNINNEEPNIFEALKIYANDLLGFTPIVEEDLQAENNEKARKQVNNYYNELVTKAGIKGSLIRAENVAKVYNLIFKDNVSLNEVNGLKKNNDKPNSYAAGRNETKDGIETTLPNTNTQPPIVEETIIEDSFDISNEKEEVKQESKNNINASIQTPVTPPPNAQKKTSRPSSASPEHQEEVRKHREALRKQKEKGWVDKISQKNAKSEEQLKKKRIELQRSIEEKAAKARANREANLNNRRDNFADISAKRALNNFVAKVSDTQHRPISEVKPVVFSENYLRPLVGLGKIIENRSEMTQQELDVELPKILDEILTFTIDKTVPSDRIQYILTHQLHLPQEIALEFGGSTAGQLRELNDNPKFLEVLFNLAQDYDQNMREVTEVQAELKQEDTADDEIIIEEEAEHKYSHSNYTSEVEIDYSDYESVDNNISEDQPKLEEVDTFITQQVEELSSRFLSDEQKEQIFNTAKQAVQSAVSEDEFLLAQGNINRFSNIMQNQSELGNQILELMYSDTFLSDMTSFDEWRKSKTNELNEVYNTQKILHQHEKLVEELVQASLLDHQLTNKIDEINNAISPDLIELEQVVADRRTNLLILSGINQTLSTLQSGYPAIIRSNVDYNGAAQLNIDAAGKLNDELAKINRQKEGAYNSDSSSPSSNVSENASDSEEEQEEQEEKSTHADDTTNEENSIESSVSSNESEFSDDEDINLVINPLSAEPLTNSEMQNLLTQFNEQLHFIKGYLDRDLYDGANNFYQQIYTKLENNRDILQHRHNNDPTNITWQNSLTINGIILDILSERKKELDQIGSSLNFQTDIDKLYDKINSISILIENNDDFAYKQNTYNDLQTEYDFLKIRLDAFLPASHVERILYSSLEKLNELSQALNLYIPTPAKSDAKLDSPPPPPDEGEDIEHETDIPDFKEIISDKPSKLEAENVIDSWRNKNDAWDDVEFYREEARTAFENGQYEQAKESYIFTQQLIEGFEDKFPPPPKTHQHTIRALNGAKLVCEAMQSLCEVKAEVELSGSSKAAVLRGMAKVDNLASRAKDELSGADADVAFAEDYTKSFKFEFDNIKNAVSQTQKEQKDLFAQADQSAKVNNLKTLLEHFQNYRTPQSDLGAMDIKAREALHKEWEKFENLREVLTARKDDIANLLPKLNENVNAAGPNAKDASKRILALNATNTLIDQALQELKSIQENINRTRVMPPQNLQDILDDINNATDTATRTRLEEDYKAAEKAWKQDLQDQLNSLESTPGTKSASDEALIDQIKWTLNPNLIEEKATEIITIEREKCGSEKEYKQKVQDALSNLIGKNSPLDSVSMDSSLSNKQRQLVDLSKQTVIMKLGTDGEESVFVKEEGKNKQDFSIAIHKFATADDERKRHIAAIAEQYIAKNPPGQMRITGRDKEMVKEVKAYVDALHDLVKDPQEKRKYERQADSLSFKDKIVHWRKVSAMKDFIEKDKKLSNIVNSKNLYVHKHGILRNKIEKRLEENENDLVAKTTTNLRMNNRGN